MMMNDRQYIIINSDAYKFSLVQHMLLLLDSQRVVWDVVAQRSPVTISPTINSVHKYTIHIP